MLNLHGVYTRPEGVKKAVLSPTSARGVIIGTWNTAVSTPAVNQQPTTAYQAAYTKPTKMSGRPPAKRPRATTRTVQLPNREPNDGKKYSPMMNQCRYNIGLNKNFKRYITVCGWNPAAPRLEHFPNFEKFKKGRLQTALNQCRALIEKAVYDECDENIAEEMATLAQAQEFQDREDALQAGIDRPMSPIPPTRDVQPIVIQPSTSAAANARDQLLSMDQTAFESLVRERLTIEAIANTKVHRPLLPSMPPCIIKVEKVEDDDGEINISSDEEDKA